MRWRFAIVLNLIFTLNIGTAWAGNACSGSHLQPSANPGHTVGRSEAFTEPDSMTLTETISSVHNGSQLFAVVHPGAADVNGKSVSAGLYRRDQRSFTMLLPGEVMVDKQGAPLITQLELGHHERQPYVVAVVNGNIYLLNGHSDFKDPKSYLQLGTKENPLYEVGSQQKRFLPLNDKDNRIEVYQDPYLSSKGSQLVMISVRFAQPQLAGDGLTLAFEILPNKENKEIIFNGQPTIIDYRFHESSQLATLVTGTKTKLVFSHILLEQFEQTDLGFFESHAPIVHRWLKKFVDQVLSTVSLESMQDKTARVAFNITENRVEKDVMFENTIYTDGGTEILQKYMISRGLSELIVKSETRIEKLAGQVDLRPDGSPAIWKGLQRDELMFSKGGKLYAVVYRQVVELGRLKDLFESLVEEQIPQELNFLTTFGGGEEVLPGAMIVAVKLPNGKEVTGAIGIKLLMRSQILTNGSFELLDWAASPADLKMRTEVFGSEPLFDTATKRSPSKEAYQQALDPSSARVSLVKSEYGALAYKYTAPKRTIPISEGLTFAEFTEIEGIENPTGLYFDLPIDKISGNEKDQFILGQILQRPGAKKGENEHILAGLDVEKNKDDVSENHEHFRPSKLMLLAMDASKVNGEFGYQLTLVARDPSAGHRIHKILFPRQVFDSFKSFKFAKFIQGQRSDRNSGYLFVTFENTDFPRGISFYLHFNLKGLTGGRTIHTIEGVGLKPEDLQNRIAFDEEGVPNLVMTPDLSSDAHKFTVLNLQTTAVEYPNGSTGKKKKLEFGAGVQGGYGDDHVPYVDSWSIPVWEIRKLYPHLGVSSELSHFDSFLALGRQLDAMSSSKEKPERRIVIVPSSLRNLVWDFILNKGFGSNHIPGSGPVDRFDSANRDLRINLLSPEKSSQEQYLSNIESWVKRSQSRPEERTITIARMDEMMKDQGPPAAREGKRAFMLNYVGAGQTGGLTGVSTSAHSVYPSALYLLAAEGPLSLREFKNLDREPTGSVLILATPEEMKSFGEKAAIEIDHGLLDRYKIQEIKDPDQESMAISISEIFKHADVKNLEYQFSAKEIKPRAELDANENFKVVIDYAISRFLGLISNKAESRFEAFVRFRSTFAAAILSDREVRRTRLVNKYFVERVLTQVFDIPMNLATLPADDPISIMSGRDALLRMHQAGYLGPFDLKAKVRDTVVSQTRAAAGKPIPSSMIVFGKTGSGKTRLFKVLIKMLNLKLFDYTNMANNTDASAMIINVGQLKDTGGLGREGDMNVDHAIGYLNYLLTMPNGYRAWILFDDMHAASDHVKAKLLNWQRSLFESPDGMYTATAETRSIRRPVRNLNIFVTLNPTADRDQISKYAKDKENPTTEEILLATLSSPNFKIEPSFLRRYGRIMNLDYMPAGAKGPALLNDMALASKALLNARSQMVLVDPRLVEQIVRDNEEVDARSFLAASTSALIDVGSSGHGSLVLVVPALKSSWAYSDSNAYERIADWIGKNARTLSLDSSLEGNLVLTKMVVDSFRMSVFESLAMALLEHPILNADPQSQRHILAPILMAVSDHLKSHPYVSVRDLDIAASELDLKTPGDRQAFKIALANMESPRSPLVPSSLVEATNLEGSWKSIVGITHEENSVSHEILAETIRKTGRILRERAQQILQVEQLEQLPKPADWLNQLSEKSQLDPKLAGQQLLANLWEFIPQILRADQIAGADSHRAPMSTYAATRLHLLAIDRAIVQMRWMRSSQFLLESLRLVAQDQVLSQHPGVQNLLFNDPQRLLQSVIPDFTFQILASPNLIEGIPQSSREQQKRDFENNVNQLISPVAKPSSE